MLQHGNIHVYVKSIFSEVYFDPMYDVCFCPDCHTSRGDNLYYTRGDSPIEYGLPIGWCKFGLR